MLSLVEHEESFITSTPGILPDSVAKKSISYYLIAPTHCIYVLVVEVLVFFPSSVSKKSISSLNSVLLQLITRKPVKIKTESFLFVLFFQNVCE